MSSENIRIFHTTKQNSLLNIINETLNQCRPENNTISDATADDDDSESFFSLSHSFCKMFVMIFTQQQQSRVDGDDDCLL